MDHVVLKVKAVLPVDVPLSAPPFMGKYVIGTELDLRPNTSAAFILASSRVAVSQLGRVTASRR